MGHMSSALLSPCSRYWPLAAAALVSACAAPPRGNVTLSGRQARPVPISERWLLVYDGDPRVKGRYNAAAYDAMLTGGVYKGACKGPLFTGVIVLNLQAPSGRWFVPWSSLGKGAPATGSDWKDFLDQLSAPNGVLARLDSATGRA